MGDKTLGLYDKFAVTRNDGSSEPGGKHHGCEYFVLDLTHDKHAEAALRAYAESCAAEYPLLAADLLHKYEDAQLSDDTSDALRFRWLCKHPDWHFIECLCREFVADSDMKFLTGLRRVIDARRAMKLEPFEEHMPPRA